MINWLRENWGSLLLSILLSLTIWIVAIQQQNPIEQREYPEPLPIETSGLPAGIVISGEHTSQARVSLRAPQSTWTALTADNIIVLADMTDLQPGAHSVPLQVQFSESIQATNITINPPEIRITLEERQQREIPVHLAIEGQPAVGYAMDAPVIEPDSVTIFGPSSLIDIVSEVSAALNVTDARQSIEAQLTPQFLDSDGNPVDGLELSETEIAVTVQINQQPGFKEVTVIARHEGTPALGYYVNNISATPLLVTLQGPPDTLDQMPDFVETPHVDLTAASRDFTRTIQLELPPDVVIVTETPVEIQVDIEAFEGSVALQRSSEFIGLDSSLEAIITPDVVDLILSGIVPILNALSEEDVRVVLDLNGLGVGTYQIVPEVIVAPSGIISETVLPTSIEVEIVIATSP